MFPGLCRSPLWAMRCLDLQDRKMGSMQRILEFQGSVSKSRQLFPRSLQSFGDQSICALQYMPRDPRDFIMVLVVFHSQVGAAQLLWFLSTQISSCGGSPGSGQGKGQHWWGCWAASLPGRTPLRVQCDPLSLCCPSEPFTVVWFGSEAERVRVPGWDHRHH